MILESGKIKYRIMVVDDNEDFRYLLRDYLELQDYCDVVVEAENGIEAMKKLELEEADIIFLDIVMPQMDGISVAYQVNQLYPNTKIIFLSARYGDELMGQINQLRVYHYLMKPIQLEHLDPIMRLLISSNEEHVVQLETTNTHLNDDKDLHFRGESQLEKLLYQIGIPHHVKGFDMIVDALNFALEIEDSFGNINKTLYQKVAEKHGTYPGNIERNIRHAIELAWDNPDNVENIEKELGKYHTQRNSKPTNKAFLKMLYKRFKNENA